MRDVQLCEQPLRERGQVRNLRAHAYDLHRPLITRAAALATHRERCLTPISRPFDPFTDRALSPRPARVQEFCEKEFHRRSAIAILNQVQLVDDHGAQFVEPVLLEQTRRQMIRALRSQH